MCTYVCLCQGVRVCVHVCIRGTWAWMSLCERMRMGEFDCSFMHFSISLGIRNEHERKPADQGAESNANCYGEVRK